MEASVAFFVVGRWTGNPKVLGSNPPPCHWMNLSLVAPKLTPPCFVNSQLVSLPPVGILNLLCLIYIFSCYAQLIIFTIIVIIVSITKFSIVIGSPRAYLSCNRRAITWVSNYSCPIWTFCNRTPVIRYPRDFHANYACFNGFLSNVFYSFQNLGKALRTLS